MYYAYHENKKVDENPLDSLQDLCCLVRFINESLGPNADELALSELGKDGFRFILNFMEITICKIQDLVSAEFNKTE